MNIPKWFTKDIDNRGQRIFMDELVYNLLWDDNDFQILWMAQFADKPITFTISNTTNIPAYWRQAVNQYGDTEEVDAEGGAKAGST